MRKRKITIEFTEPMTDAQYNTLANKVCLMVDMVTETDHWVIADDGATVRKLNRAWKNLGEDLPWGSV